MTIAVNPSIVRWFWACGAGLSVVGCRLLFGLDPEPDARGPIACPQGLTDAGDVFWPKWKPVQNASECEIASVPDRPAQFPDAGGATVDQTIYLALSELRVDDADAGFGLDLDGCCTTDCRGRTPACKTSRADGRGCRDNAVAQMMKRARDILPQLTEDNINCELQRGGFNVLTKLSHYNGQPYDPEVRVDVYAALRWTNFYLTCDSGPDEPHNVWMNKPLADRQWSVAPESKASLDSLCELSGVDGGLPGAKVCTTNAFVYNRYLVAEFTDAEFSLNDEQAHFPGFHMFLKTAFLVGQLRQEQSAPGETVWRLNGTLGGVTTVRDMLAGFERLGVCEATCPRFPSGASGGYGLTMGVLTDHQDISIQPGQCDGISAGWELKAEQVLGGELGRGDAGAPRAKQRTFSGLCLFPDAAAECGQQAPPLTHSMTSE